MSDQHAEGIKPDLPPSAALSPGENIFVTRTKFPAQADAQIASVPGPPRLRKKSNRILLAMVLLVLIIGSIAWTVQNLPNWRSRRSQSRLGPDKQLFEFKEKQALWDPEDKSYVQEYEREVPGFYDYPFENTIGAAQMGLLQTSCDCTKVEIALLSPEQWKAWQKTREKRREVDGTDPGEKFSWKTIAVNDREGLEVPENGKGLVRISWKGRKSEGQRLRLRVGLWMQPRDKMRDRQFVYLETPTVMVAPVVFTQTKLSLGVLSSGSSAGEFYCWSATRAKPNLKLQNDNPLFTWTMTPLNEAECRALENKLRTEINTRVRAAFHVKVTVHESKDGKQLDQGHFHVHAPLFLDGHALANLAPMVYGKVRGEVEVGGNNDDGKIQLESFKVKEGTKKQIVLWTDPDTGLEFVSRQPAFFQVKLVPAAKESTTKKSKWILEVVVSPSFCPAGPLPADSAILLRTQTTPPRQIRIPVLGTAVQG